MTILSVITVALSAGYGALMVLYCVGWRKQKRLQRFQDWPRPHRKFSVIIPARNEAANVAPLLQSILAQDFEPSSYEVILVDDHSTDGTSEEASRIADVRVRVLKLADHLTPGEKVQAAKKRALALGISHARHSIIVTTDADCVVHPTWLDHLSAAFSGEQIRLVAAPVNFQEGSGVLYLFQSLDFMAMQGITAAAHSLRLGSMTNGANLAFGRAAFDEVGGYAGIDQLASGDDYLLTRKIVTRYGTESMRYVLAREAIVTTAAQPTWMAFLHQRIRWASKSGKYNDPRLTAILMLVYATNVWLLALAVISPFVAGAGKLFLASLAAKTILEIGFLLPVAGFFGKRRELLVFPLLQPLHIVYVVLAGFLGMRGGYKWKGRDVR